MVFKRKYKTSKISKKRLRKSVRSTNDFQCLGTGLSQNKYKQDNNLKISTAIKEILTTDEEILDFEPSDDESLADELGRHKANIEDVPVVNDSEMKTNEIDLSANNNTKCEICINYLNGYSCEGSLDHICTNIDLASNKEYLSKINNVLNSSEEDIHLAGIDNSVIGSDCFNTDLTGGQSQRHSDLFLTGEEDGNIACANQEGESISTFNIFNGCKMESFGNSITISKTINVDNSAVHAPRVIPKTFNVSQPEVIFKFKKFTRRWNKKFDPKYNLVRLFLQDKIFSNANFHSTDIHCHIPNIETTDTFFKVPLLPAEKSGSDRNSIASTTSSLREKPNLIAIKEHDDVISLYGSTIFDDGVDTSFNDTKCEADTNGNDSLPDDTKVKCIQEWVEKNNMIPIHKIDFCSVPMVYKQLGLCFYHFLNHNCNKKICNRHHMIPLNIVQKLSSCSIPELLSTYKWTLDHEFLYQSVFRSFATTFGERKLRNELLQMMAYIFQNGIVDKMSGIEIFVKSLQETGLSFQSAVELIIEQNDLSNCAEISDILLDLVSKQINVTDKWGIIEKLVAGRTAQLDPAVVLRLIHKCICVYPVNTNFCLNVSEHIIKKGLIDTSKIPDTVIMPLNKVLQLREVNVNYIHDQLDAQSSLGTASSGFDVNDNGSLVSEMSTDENDICGTSPIHDNLPSSPENSFSHCDVSSDESIGNISNHTYVVSTGIHTQTRQQELPIGNIMLESEKRGIHNDIQPLQDHLIIGSSIGDIVEKKLNNCYETFETNRARKNIYEENRKTHENHKRIYNQPNNTHRSNKITSTTNDIPVLGSLSYDPNYKFNVSLHNLFPVLFDSVEINDDDIMHLNNIIEQADGQAYLDLLEMYKEPCTIKSFICMTVASLKSYSLGPQMFSKLLSSIEKVNQHYLNNRSCKAVLEVVTMNLLIEIEKKGLWGEAVCLLHKFKDWDSLVSSKIFSRKFYSFIGRYVTFAKLFIKAKQFNWANEILQCHHLKLLDSYEKWPNRVNERVDVKNRDRVLTEFFENGYYHNIIAISDMYKRVILVGKIHGYDAIKHLNPMFINLLREKKITILKHLIRDLNVYCSFIDVNVLRLMVIVAYNELTEDDRCLLYKACCKRGIYQDYTGNERKLTFTTNLFNQELSVCLKKYFQSMIERQCHPKDINIDIRVPAANNSVYPKLLENFRSLQDMYVSLKKILEHEFNIVISDKVSPTIYIPCQNVISFLSNQIYGT